jgi:post-segregation antitoxin (ccd killing protein)
MDITVYLPDELGKWAKEHDLNLSRMLRAALETEQHRRGAVAYLLEEAATYNLAVLATDLHGRDAGYTARLHGAFIATQHLSGNGGDVNVYVGEDRKIYVHDADGQLYSDVGPDALREYLDDPAYIMAMNALGEEAIIDLGLPEQRG